MDRRMQILIVLAALLSFVSGNVLTPPDISTRFHVTEKEIHLKHGKLYEPHRTQEDHVRYRYRWLEDDIINNDENELEEGTDEATEKTVQLPGGCELTETQFEELESFEKETEYVKKCYCEQGGVYCQLRKSVLDQNLT